MIRALAQEGGELKIGDAPGVSKERELGTAFGIGPEARADA